MRQERIRHQKAIRASDSGSCFHQRPCRALIVSRPSLGSPDLCHLEDSAQSKSNQPERSSVAATLRVVTAKTRKILQYVRGALFFTICTACSSDLGRKSRTSLACKGRKAAEENEGDHLDCSFDLAAIFSLCLHWCYLAHQNNEGLEVARGEEHGLFANSEIQRVVLLACYDCVVLSTEDAEEDIWK